MLSSRHHENKFYVTTTLVFDGAPQDSASRWDNVRAIILPLALSVYISHIASFILQLLFATTNVSSPSSWSDPIHFSFEGYDTSLFFDTSESTSIDPHTGNATKSNKTRVYVQGSHAWRVFPAIQQFEIDLKTGESLSGKPRTIWEGTGGLVSLFGLKCIAV